MDQKSSSDTHSSPHHGHRRSHSTHIERPQSPVAHQRSSSVAADRSTMPAHRSNSMTSGSPTLHKRSHSEARSSPNSSLGRLPTHSSSSVFAMANSKNSKGTPITCPSSFKTPRFNFQERCYSLYYNKTSRLDTIMSSPIYTRLLH